jgi:glycosyltransferase involved in cell wall biosynthesis
MNPKKYLFLYTILPDYFYNCILHLVLKTNSDAFIVVSRLDKASFYEKNNRIKIIEYSSFETLRLSVNNFKPDIIYICGWSSFAYNLIGFSYRKTAKVILGIDNLYIGSLKQQLGLHILDKLLSKITSWVWVPGKNQYFYSRLLGFKSNRILESLYVSNQEVYKYIGPNIHTKRVYFIGRLVMYKNPLLLLEVFNSLLRDYPNLSNWELYICGSGELKDEILSNCNSNIKFIEYINPKQLSEELNNATFVCIPSRNENWGVVLHEATSIGLPILCSDSVGASADLLIDSYNGYRFSLDKEGDFREKMVKMLTLANDDFLLMGKNSNTLSKKINYDIWVAQFLSTLEA